METLSLYDLIVMTLSLLDDIDHLEGGRIFKVKLNTDLRKVLCEETGTRGHNEDHLSDVVLGAAEGLHGRAQGLSTRSPRILGLC